MDLAIFGDQPEVSREQLMALQNENSGFGVKLDGTNYLVWRLLMKMHLGGVGKWEYVVSTLQRPKEVGKAQAMWDAANSNTMVLYDIATHNKSQDKMRVHIFLNGLCFGHDPQRAEQRHGSRQ
ncbi:hypothetical protein ACLB2K_020080 [Fragaria x ananassa]